MQIYFTGLEFNSVLNKGCCLGWFWEWPRRFQAGVRPVEESLVSGALWLSGSGTRLLQTQHVGWAVRLAHRWFVVWNPRNCHVTTHSLLPCLYAHILLSFRLPFSSILQTYSVAILWKFIYQRWDPVLVAIYISSSCLVLLFPSLFKLFFEKLCVILFVYEEWWVITFESFTTWKYQSITK